MASHCEEHAHAHWYKYRRWIEWFAPLFEKHKVDLVFNGHDHYYARTKPLAKKPGGHGVIYIVTGGGGAPLYGATKQPWAEVIYRGYHFVVCEATPEKLSLEARTPEGKVIDGFTIERKAPPVGVSYDAYITAARQTSSAGYTTERRNNTQGRAAFTMHFEHHEAVPFAIAEEIIEERTKRRKGQ